MQIEMIQEWIEKVRAGSDGAVGGCGSDEQKGAAGIWERAEVAQGFPGRAFEVRQELAVITRATTGGALKDGLAV